MDFLKAHTAAVKALCSHGLTAATADEIVSFTENHQPQEWARTLGRVAAGEAKRVRLFVIWNGLAYARQFRTFLYSGDQDNTVAHLWRSLGEEGQSPIACFDIGADLRAAVVVSASVEEVESR